MIETTKANEASAEDMHVATPKAAQTSTRPAKTQSLSMHANVPIWYDCCSCEAEPYWLEAMENKSDEDS